MVASMSDTGKETHIQRITLTESKTVADLLLDLNLSNDHVVLVQGKRVPLDFRLQENDSIVILPLIAGG